MRSLVTLLRGAFAEVRIAGEIAVHDGEKLLFGVPSPLSEFPTRSLLKPFQFNVTGLPIDAAAPARTAAQVGSVSATAEQVAQLEAWYGKDEWPARRAELQVTPAYPMDDLERGKLKAADQGPGVIYSNCFSKHLGILKSCQLNGWDPGTYRSTFHPYHARLSEALAEWTDRDARTVSWVVDGCGLPTPVLKMSEMARLFHGLNRPELLDISNLMMKYPEWVGGPGRQDTRLMELNPGKVIAKEGADGLLGVCVRPNPDAPQGLGIIIKTWAGYQPLFAVLALRPVFEKFGLSFSAPTPRGQEARYEYTL